MFKSDSQFGSRENKWLNTHTEKLLMIRNPIKQPTHTYKPYRYMRLRLTCLEQILKKMRLMRHSWKLGIYMFRNPTTLLCKSASELVTASGSAWSTAITEYREKPRDNANGGNTVAFDRFRKNNKLHIYTTYRNEAVDLQFSDHVRHPVKTRPVPAPNHRLVYTNWQQQRCDSLAKLRVTHGGLPGWALPRWEAKTQEFC